MTQHIRFDINARDGAARSGVLSTPRGDIATPAFMPVGTQATVKAMRPESVRETGADIILGNTYHLMLRPGAERVAKLGGLHQFMNWPHPILTDSGGFQVMSLAKLRKISETGVEFQSHIDGSTHMLTPERAIEIQCLLGADIQMVLDECTPFPATHDEAARSMEMSMRWAARSKQAFGDRPGQALFGIVQGSIYKDLRVASLQALMDIGFDGYAIGGLAVGEGREMTARVLDWMAPLMPEDRPHYLMGVGKPEDIVAAVAHGMDMFDCVLPTRSGRHGQAFYRGGELNLRNARHGEDPNPIDPACSCPTCQQHSRAYLHHLFRAGEYLGPMLLTWHNLHYYQDFMSDLREAIEHGRFAAFAESIKARPEANAETAAERSHRKGAIGI